MGGIDDIKWNPPLLRNIFAPGGRASIPPLIAAKASLSGTGVDVQVILISPCYERVRDVNRKEEGCIAYPDFRDDYVRGRTTKLSRLVCHNVAGFVTAFCERMKCGRIYRKSRLLRELEMGKQGTRVSRYASS